MLKLFHLAPSFTITLPRSVTAIRSLAAIQPGCFSTSRPISSKALCHLICYVVSQQAGPLSSGDSQ
jgi:hypothetical protein